ncbi:UNVERIFIED_CONTAM: hypothetical protein HDU68_003101 [Siphonaria sp. JEL0065]|nr:hypothetical protein HDU68_003101 [Siphonaria sp. JEL0065]
MKSTLLLGVPPITPTNVGHQPGQPSHTLYSKPIKVRKLGGNKDIVAGESGIPANVYGGLCSR